MQTIHRVGTGSSSVRRAFLGIGLIVAMVAATLDNARAEPAPPECADFAAVERPAMLGKLSDAEVQCLEWRYGHFDLPTHRDKASRILMANAYGKGDMPEWKRLTMRHIDEVDDSDPNLSFKLAQVFAREEEHAPTEVIRWSTLSLLHRGAWDPDDYTSRVPQLHAMRVKSAKQIWEQATAAHKKTPTPTTEAAEQSSAASVREFSREWVLHCKRAHSDAKEPLAICRSAGGGADYCNGV